MTLMISSKQYLVSEERLPELKNDFINFPVN